MIWYILYPFRGTTEPPRLSASHPLRRIFQAHGAATARHWLLSIVLTVVVSVLLCYPALFQTDSPAAVGLRNLPKHVWTSTTEVVDDRPADVEMRQVWVHGDYMTAIHRRVLQEALEVQNALVGDGYDSDGSPRSNDPTPPHGCPARPESGFSWGLHSPLMYWDCSERAIQQDANPLATINAQTAKQSSLNLTLRPSTVFAGKLFTKQKLRAADALVITLFDQTNATTLGQAWDSRSAKLAQELPPEWALFPADGQIHASRLYEFRFKPMTLSDDLFLAASYLITAVYVISRMMQLRAFKSWFGLLVTICAKMTICIIGSFTVCSYLGINLGRIPRPWFPGVVFCYGLGNIFRLINAVLETPPEMPPIQRIGNAIGEVGHLSLAVAGQNLVLIWLCSKLVTPWVADFCVFAAVTLVLDFVFHLTFFVAVLSVDVQRLELQDSLARVNLTQQNSKRSKHERLSWLGAFRQGTLPLSTRFAGSVAIFSIILALNWHFFETDEKSLSQLSIGASIESLFPKRARQRQRQKRSLSPWTPPPINQARTPAEWLSIQDHNTARELFGFIKPDAHILIARVYDPLLVVLKGAKGRDTSQKVSSLIESARRFAKEHAFPAALIVVFLIAGVTLLMNYLLWTGLPEIMEDEEDEEALFSVLTLPTSQTLDIVRLASCPKGHIASVSLDRSTSVWLHERGTGYTNTTLQTAAVKPKLWPIIASTMDDSGTLLALCTDTGQLGLWSLPEARFLLFSAVSLPPGHSLSVFSFASIRSPDNDNLSLIIVTPDGYLTQVNARTGIHQRVRICSTSIVCAILYPGMKDDTSVVYVSKPGEVHILPLSDEGKWTPEVVAGLDPGPPPGSNPSKIKCVHPVSSLGLMFAIRSGELELFDFSSRVLIHARQIGQVKTHSFRVMHSARRVCVCGAPAVHSLTLAYTEQVTGQVILHSFTMDDTPSSQICLGKPSENETIRCKGLDHATEAMHFVDSAGAWEATNSMSIVGIRKCNHSPTPSSTASGVDENYQPISPSTLGQALKMRAAKDKKNSNASLFSFDGAFDRISSHNIPAPTSDSESWEAWSLSSTGVFQSRPLVEEVAEDGVELDDELFVASAGPISRIGKRSVAVGFANTIKIITIGKESFDVGPGLGKDDGVDLGVGSYKWRTRRAPGRKML
ncbi:hypothetical protein P154DRAFT_532454 [Amniculicola lignicola CBS 123094]|uniref:Sterol regulatory element-binding protein cleavage-activating protein n=1 Tax=Amniculicola lignicola CBS 123094 TaxID=1392246 RepID=A0A6A5WR10_9PLEO|nr:hypothetical protein P154DRAFT_532454 [Amniculicola lignicola CBS 123094]